MLVWVKKRSLCKGEMRMGWGEMRVWIKTSIYTLIPSEVEESLVNLGLEQS